jgi:hypothetical protein
VPSLAYVAAISVRHARASPKTIRVEHAIIKSIGKPKSSTRKLWKIDLDRIGRLHASLQFLVRLAVVHEQIAHRLPAFADAPEQKTFELLGVRAQRLGLIAARNDLKLSLFDTLKGLGPVVVRSLAEIQGTLVR